MFFLLVIADCKTERKPDVVEEKPPVTEKQQDLTKLQFCTEMPLVLKESDKLKPKAVILRSYLWRHDVRFPLKLSVRFLNGTDFQKNKVMQYAKEWNLTSAEGDHNDDRKIRIQFIPYDITTSGNVADIRIMFRDGGSSSTIGTAAKLVPQDQATMFFGWINENQTEEVLRRTILHEFGHALGLIHEHQSPVVNIPWDKEKVYEYYRITQNPPWSREQVDVNIFERYSEESTNHTDYDSTSIMHYPVPEELTIGDFSIPWNNVLSDKDKDFIKEIYKYRPCIVNETCCFDRRTGREIPCP